MRNSAKQMALGGVMAALAVVIMAMGGMIPAATYVCPMLCMLLQSVVLQVCGRRVAWAWYGAVSLLSLLLSPDKEAAAVFLFLGYYPVLKPGLDRRKLNWLWKGLLFNGAILVMYWLLLRVFGMAQVAAEFTELGRGMLAVLLLLGNVVFFLMDRVLGRFKLRKK